MRIVHTCLRYPPASGGAETYIKETVERTRSVPSEPDPTNSDALGARVGRQNLVGPEASDNLRDVRVLTSKMRTHHPISELNPELLLDDPMYVQRLHHMSTPIFAYPRLQALKYYIGHHQPDILHSYGFWYQPADVTARYAKEHNIPFIFHPLYYENEGRQKFFWQAYKNFLGKKTFAAADVVVVISPFEQSLIEHAAFEIKRLELIPPGVEMTRFEQPRLNPFLKRNIKGKILLSVSRLASGKGLEDMILALPSIIKASPDTQLVIIGEDFGAQNNLQNVAHTAGVENSTHFWGKVDEETLVAAYQHADVLVHPSYYEAFGIVLAESLAAGTPVVARNSTAIPFVAPHERTGLLFNTPEELAEHTITLLRNDSLREKYGQAGIKHIRENFNWEKGITKILGLYDEFRKS